ncbi:5'-methylthioadenosine/S-adenosylhomocysteine nucleosidase [Oceanispirochaeta sp.]|jgi:adenosylhomocysteine nucleosidase|uniref:5'-methylthioadenosine/S-adenosylhomocysteine nucleosidase n=1 Tax=Oceanispirochaeta sp. TaxID=2035350 RepID=UPI00260FF2AB|nr:5'-methylthioadenosine/S-adenosylhomocysteine nucleosidase [Oceanispirochaeta sp.]MDA3957126.1 5'-methylthioadenosine/S-adenosylhomocysteine nucleosidase [Oceanispirochaeta sp.]
MKKILAVLNLFLLLGTSLWAESIQVIPSNPQVERIAIVSAFGPEVVKLKSIATIEEEIVINGKSFTLCEIEGKKAVLFLSGVSMVNAAMTTQLALDSFNISHILFSGIAGGVNPDLNIGDVTVPAKWAQYQESLFARKTEDGYNLGWHQEIYPGFGMMFPQNVEVTHGRLDDVDGTEDKFWFDVDQELLAVAEKISDVTLLSETDEAKLSHVPKLVVGGTGVSGMTFVDNAEYREWAFDNFQAACLDMESAAVAHVAYVADVPFIAFRSLSDLAGGGEGENEMGTFFGLAADNAAEVLLQFLKAWN